MQEFEVNPNFFNSNRNLESIAKDGIHIDQSNFHPTLDKTDYVSFFIVDSNSTYWD